MPSTFADRLEQALKDAGRDRGDLARVLRSTTGKLGISQSAVGQLLDGKSKSMTAENCARAARFLGVNQYWLATGEGPMRDGPIATDAPANESPAGYYTASEIVDQLGELLARVPPSVRSSVADVLHAWAKDGGSASEDDRRQALAALLQIRSQPHTQQADLQKHEARR